MPQDPVKPKETPAQRAKRMGLLIERTQPKFTSQQETPAERAERIRAVREEPRSLTDKVLAHLLNIGAGPLGIGEAVQAFAGSMGSKFTDTPMSYTESLNVLRGETGRITPTLRAAERMAGGARYVPFKSPAAQGAAVGAANEAFRADPIESWTDVAQRAGKTAAGAAVGAGVGKALDLGTTGLRVATTPGYAENLNRQIGERARVASEMYGAARAAGQGKEATAALTRFLNEPDVKPIVDDLVQRRSLVGAQPYQIVEALSKELSALGGKANRQLLAGSANANVARMNQADTRLAKEGLFTAAETPEVGVVAPAPFPPGTNLAIPAPYAPGSAGFGTATGAGAPIIPPTKPPVMPGLRGAEAEFAARSRAMDALTRGYQAERSMLGKGLPSPKAAATTSPPAFQRWLGEEGRLSSDIAQASAGVLGGAKDALAKGDPLFRTLTATSNVMRRVPSTSQRSIEALLQSLLVGGAQGTNLVLDRP